jgi:hypothetical protein
MNVNVRNFLEFSVSRRSSIFFLGVLLGIQLMTLQSKAYLSSDIEKIEQEKKVERVD